jgi:transposase
MRPKCRILLKKYDKKHFILDDESYFTLSNYNMSGNDIFYSNDLSLTPDSVSSKYCTKYEKKVLVYLVMSPKGMCTPYFRPSGLAINQDVYLEDCIKKKLVPFIQKHYQEGQYVFWPDLASSHYGGRVQEYLKSNKICYVPKWCNPANCPKLRPIEDLWANIKQKVYENNWSANNLDQLRLKISSVIRNLDPELVQKHGESVKNRLYQLVRYNKM